jgi:hypothetical protein
MRRQRRQPTRAEWRAVTSSRPVVRRIPPARQLRAEAGMRARFGPGLAALNAMPVCGRASPGRWERRCRQHPRACLGRANSHYPGEAKR